MRLEEKVWAKWGFRLERVCSNSGSIFTGERMLNTGSRLIERG